VPPWRASSGGLGLHAHSSAVRRRAAPPEVETARRDRRVRRAHCAMLSQQLLCCPWHLDGVVVGWVWSVDEAGRANHRSACIVTLTN
jgi:hypothetical protein